MRTLTCVYISITPSDSLPVYICSDLNNIHIVSSSESTVNTQQLKDAPNDSIVRSGTQDYIVKEEEETENTSLDHSFSDEESSDNNCKVSDYEMDTPVPTPFPGGKTNALDQSAVSDIQVYIWRMTYIHVIYTWLIVH